MGNHADCLDDSNIAGFVNWDGVVSVPKMTTKSASVGSQPLGAPEGVKSP